MSIEILVFRLAIAALVLGIFIVAHRMVFKNLDLHEIDLSKARKVVIAVTLGIVAIFAALLFFLFLFGGN